MTLEEVEQLIKNAKFPWDVFSKYTYKTLAGITHPDRNGGEDRVFKLLQEIAELMDHPCILANKYHRGLKFASGDISDLYYGAEGTHPNFDTLPKVILKIARSPNVNNLMAKEKEVLTQLVEKSGTTIYVEYFPTPVETFVHDKCRVNVFEWQPDFYTAERVGKVHGHHVVWMFKRLMTALGYCHRQGWVHGAVLPQHIMYHAKNHGLHLIGWTSAEKIGKPIKVVPTKYKDWYPEECKRKENASPQTDIYMAAKTILSLAKEDETPKPLILFLKGCMLESRNMRPSDAWAVHDDWDKLARRVYGKPKFVNLEIGE